MTLSIGDKAPIFSLLNQDGVITKLSDFKGQWVLLYFYPEDDTPGCTTEACGLRDSFPHFQNEKLQIIGISNNSVASHKKFATKYKLPFTLLADTEKKMVKDYDVWGEKKLFAHLFDGIRRTSFLVNPEGTIVKIYEKVNTSKHAEQVLEDFKNIAI